MSKISGYKAGVRIYANVKPTEALPGRPNSATTGGIEKVLDFEIESATAEGLIKKVTTILETIKED